MVDVLDSILRLRDREALSRTRRLDDVLDALNREIKQYVMDQVRLRVGPCLRGASFCVPPGITWRLSCWAGGAASLSPPALDAPGRTLASPPSTCSCGAFLCPALGASISRPCDWNPDQRLALSIDSRRGILACALRVSHLLLPC
jgi:hypothetical protein